MKHAVRSSMAVVALAAAVLSYQSLAHLGQLAGYGSLAFLYPIVIDAGAAASCAAWLHTRGRQPLAMTWCLLVISVALNGTTHYLESTGTPPSWWLVVAVAAVPPAVLGCTVHLAVGMGGDDPGRPAAGRADPGQGVGVAESPGVETTDPVADLIESGAGRRRVAAELGISEHAARQLVAARRNGVSP